MRRSVPVASLVLGCLVLIACSSSSSSSGSLTGKTWQWTGWTAQDPASQSVVPDPENYTLVFLKGSFTAKADCNTVSGTWVTSSPGSLTMTPTSSSENTCEAGSLGETYVADLGKAASYVFDGGQLKITNADQGTMTFK